MSREDTEWPGYRKGERAKLFLFCCRLVYAWRLFPPTPTLRTDRTCPSQLASTWSPNRLKMLTGEAARRRLNLPKRRVWMKGLLRRKARRGFRRRLPTMAIPQMEYSRVCSPFRRLPPKMRMGFPMKLRADRKLPHLRSLELKKVRLGRPLVFFTWMKALPRRAQRSASSLPCRMSSSRLLRLPCPIRVLKERAILRQLPSRDLPASSISSISRLAIIAWPALSFPSLAEAKCFWRNSKGMLAPLRLRANRQTMQSR